MCKRFEEGLNEDIRLLIEILKIREFTILTDRAHKVEELSKEKKQVEREAQVSGKRTMGKLQSFTSKKLKRYYDRVTISMGYSGRERGSQCSNPRFSSSSVTSMGSVGNPKPKCKHCNKFHNGECRSRSEACFGCGSLDHFRRDYPKRVEKEIELAPKPSNPVSRGRLPRYPGNVSGS
ncbi:uncharacterized protein [Gossypium hirsutum]|uniref:Gag-Pol polyprotein n=1 Tax=Gossypium hirsutum TaxID=3635 RepID=A0ABM2ZBZ5_GOSHI|nr:uncharacterized protein LOC121211498 [Gossypium hirsutum]